MSATNVTIIVQGKSHPNGISCLENYLKFGSVIISCWEKDTLPNNLPKNIKIVKNKYPSFSTFNGSNFYYQVFSTLSGVLLAESEFVIKVRSDEYYEDLSVLINKLIKYPNKLITNNVFFRFDSQRKFHVSDHMFAGKKLNIIKMLQWTNFVALKNAQKIGGWDFGSKLGELCAEQVFCIAFLKGLNININMDESRKIMLENIDLVKVSDFGKFIVHCNSCKDNDIYSSDTVKAYASIESMEEL